MSKQRLSRTELARALSQDGYEDEAQILRDSLKSSAWDKADDAAREQSPEQGLHGAIRNALTGQRADDDEVA